MRNSVLFAVVISAVVMVDHSPSLQLEGRVGQHWRFSNDGTGGIGATLAKNPELFEASVEASARIRREAQGAAVCSVARGAEARRDANRIPK